MTLNEAIKHAEEEASRNMGLCAAEHGQLAEWLKELSSLRADLAAKSELAESLNRLAGTLREENAALREELRKAMHLLEGQAGLILDYSEHVTGTSKQLEDLVRLQQEILAALTGREG